MTNELISIDGPGPLNEIGTPKPPRVIDWTKPVQTVGSYGIKRLVKVYAIDHGLKQPVVGVMTGDNTPQIWSYDGRFKLDEECGMDLENVPETPTDAQILDMVDGKAVSL